MRLTTLGIMTLPVVVGGLAIAAAVVVNSPPESPAPSPGGTVDGPTRTGPDGDGGDGGTEIEGTRPHLTVRDGASTVYLPGSISGFLSLLPPPTPELPPLTPLADVPRQTGEPGRRSGDFPPVDAPLSGIPAPGLPPSTPSDEPDVAPLPDETATPGPTAPSAPTAMVKLFPSRPPTAEHPESPQPESDTASPMRVDADRSGGDAPPPHAADRGRPDHADTTGPPPHASARTHDQGRGSDDRPPPR